MELTPYLDGLRRDLAAAAAPGGAEVQQAAELIGGSLEASVRLCLLEALSDAAAEITTRLDGGSVDVRLRGREAQFVVTAAPPLAGQASQPAPASSPPPSAESSDLGDIARITLRLPEGLKEAAERAAAAEAISVNAWLVRAIARVLSDPGPGATPPGPLPRVDPRLGRRVTGFAQA
ncbi:MAG: hypothetical protein QOE61_3504 [Micromonosporaceae bacterium]|jgi:hypothetical protein|nr:hypothetical protein [Micromonosporaceae bacterium]